MGSPTSETAVPDPDDLEPSAVCIRSIAPADAEQIKHLFQRLDMEDRYLRWFTGVPDIRPAARRAVQRRSPRDVGLVAVVGDEVIGHAMLAPVNADRAEVAFEVDPRWRRHGVAGKLLTALDEAAGNAGFQTLVADVLYDNHDMLAVFREHGPHHETRDAGVVHVTLAVHHAPKPDAERRRAPS